MKTLTKSELKTVSGGSDFSNLEVAAVMGASFIGAFAVSYGRYRVQGGSKSLMALGSTLIAASGAYLAHDQIEGAYASAKQTIAPIADAVFSKAKESWAQIFGKKTNQTGNGEL